MASRLIGPTWKGREHEDGEPQTDGSCVWLSTALGAGPLSERSCLWGESPCLMPLCPSCYGLNALPSIAAK